MSRFFPGTIIVLFLAAAALCFLCSDYKKGYFYLLSALININVLYL